METVACNLCGQSKGSQLYKRGDLRYEVCNNCGLVYMNPRKNAAEYKEYYNDEYQSARHGIKDFADAVKRLENKGSYEAKKAHLQFVGNYVNKGARVFEIGSGWGSLLALLQKEKGAAVKGLEISELAVRVAREHYGLDIEHKVLEEYLPLAKEKFDLVIMNHVLEHFLDPKKVLTDIKNIVAPGAVLYIAVPNVLKPDVRLSRFYHVNHTYYFSQTTLGEILARAGYKVIEHFETPTDIRVIAGILPGGRDGLLSGEAERVREATRARFIYDMFGLSLLSRLLKKFF